MPRLCSSLLLSLLFASSASAVTMVWTPIGNPGNASDTNPSTGGCGSTVNRPCGAVPYAYSIGTYEVTNAQYAEFLNAKAASDPYELYHPGMGFSTAGDHGGITRDGSGGGYAYSTIAGRENMPVTYVSFYDAVRFANWMNNGQGNGDTETGAYTLLGGSATPSNGDSVTRNAGASIFLPSDNEWHKAAYYDPSTLNYFTYPARTNMQVVCSAPTATANHANCNYAVDDFTNVGSYTGSASPYGTFDQGGNAWEWTEQICLPCSQHPDPRILRGGYFRDDPLYTAASSGSNNLPSIGALGYGFRLATIVPEPGTGLLVIAGLTGLAVRRRARD